MLPTKLNVASATVNILEPAGLKPIARLQIIMNYEAHLFICTNKKDGKPCCADKDSESFRKNLKDLAKQKWGRKVRVNASGCLDQCEKGIAAVLYPKGEWFTELTNSSEDTERLLHAISEVVDRLPGKTDM
jgi:(2Fe-2S) ferredoxin